MPKTHSPKDTITVGTGRKLKIGDTVLIKATVTRLGRNTQDTADEVTVKMGGYDYPVTANPKYLLADGE